MKPAPLVLFLLFAASLGAAERWNVLFIASDDMRPQLGCYTGTRW